MSGGPPKGTSTRFLESLFEKTYGKSAVAEVGIPAPAVIRTVAQAAPTISTDVWSVEEKESADESSSGVDHEARQAEHSQSDEAKGAQSPLSPDSPMSPTQRTLMASQQLRSVGDYIMQAEREWMEKERIVNHARRAAKQRFEATKHEKAYFERLKEAERKTRMAREKEAGKGRELIRSIYRKHVHKRSTPDETVDDPTRK